MAENGRQQQHTATPSKAGWSRGPRSLMLKRCDQGFGFTLRHFIVYPPEEYTVRGGGPQQQAMDTIFVKHVHDRSPASAAGLATGDRIVSVNGDNIAGRSYAHVVQLIQHSGAFLQLVVVPKEHDILQLYFGETAHNPETNQRPSRLRSPECAGSGQKVSAIPARIQHAGPAQNKHRSAKHRNSLDSRQSPEAATVEHGSSTSRHRAASRRASEGNNAGKRDSELWHRLDPDSMVLHDATSVSSCDVATHLTDSKDSLSSFDSTSTLTGLDQSSDDSLIMSRIRKSFEQKEEFLRRPTQPLAASSSDEQRGGGMVAREFYARPQKLKPVWPPPKPANQSLRRVKGDLDSERDHEQPMFECGGQVNNVPDVTQDVRRQARSFVTTLSRIQESLVYHSSGGSGGEDESCSLPASMPSSPPDQLNRCVSSTNRYGQHGPLVQLVSRRARQFESGQLEEEDGDRMRLYRSELSRLTSKRSVPNVAVRKREIEARSAGERNRESRSMEPPPQQQATCDVSPRNDSVSLRARSNSAESWAAAFGTPRHTTLDWPHVDVDQAARHKAVRQDSYLAAVRTPVHSESRCSRQLKRQSGSLEEDVTPPPPSPVRPTRLVLPPQLAEAHTHTHTHTEQLMSALDSAQAASNATNLDPLAATVVRRQKNPHHNLLDDDRLRRASYLKATDSDRMHVDSDHEYSDSEQKHNRSANRKWRPPMFPDDIQQLRQFFEEGARPIAPAHRSNVVSPVPTVVQEDKENLAVVREGWLHCKITVQDGKRSSDRSWKLVWASLSDRTLSLYRERPTQQAPTSTDNEPQRVDITCSQTDVAGGGYTKKKHVVRVNTLSCSELLLQAEDATDAARWTLAIQDQAATKDTDCTATPQPGKGVRKLTSFRNRSPTGQSPVSKTLKPCQAEPLASPKTKTWKGRVVRQLRRIHHGAGSPSSPTAPHPDEGSTIGVLLEDCPPADTNQFLPFLVVKCAGIVEERGLDIIGIYRVPGNTAAVSSLTEAVNKGFQFISYQDPRWNDVNVISSLLKLFFRRLPDALLTSELYPQFIDADKMDDPNKRITTMRRLIHELPDHHFETLKYLMRHLKKVVQHSVVNKMEARNLAIVFGPTLVRTADNNMVTMVTDMSHQCRIVESLILYVDWFFSEDADADGSFPFTFQQDGGAMQQQELEPSAMNHDLLLSNIQKVEGMKSESTSGKDILSKVIGSSIISAANRKMQKAKSRKTNNNNNSSGGGGSVGAVPAEVADSDGKKPKEARVSIETVVASSIHGSVVMSGHIVQNIQAATAATEQAVVPGFEDGTIRTYAGLSATTQERIRKFEQETKAMLQRDLTRPRREPDDVATLQRRNGDSEATTDNIARPTLAATTSIPRVPTEPVVRAACNIHSNPLADRDTSVRRVNSVENLAALGETRKVINSGTLKRFKTGKEQLAQPSLLMSSLRCGSLDSLHEALTADRPPSQVSDDGSDLLSSLTCTFDRKLRSLLTNTAATSEEEQALIEPGSAVKCGVTEKKVSRIPTYRDPSLHRAASATRVLVEDLCVAPKEDKELIRRRWIEDSCSPAESSSVRNATPEHIANSVVLRAEKRFTTIRRPETISCDTRDDRETVGIRKPETISCDTRDDRETVGIRKPEAISCDTREDSETVGIRRPETILCDTREDRETVGIRRPETILCDTREDRETVGIRRPETISCDTHEDRETVGIRKPEAILCDTREDSETVGIKRPETRTDEVLRAIRRPESLGPSTKENSQAKDESTAVNSKLKRSESLTKQTEKDDSSSSTKLRRSESLTKAEEKQNKLKRSDSLTKTEKTESNISKRRQSELVSHRRKEKENVSKLKRKNGMPDRSIKRRHTVGGTKDFDKLNWLDNRLQQEQLDQVADVNLVNKERRCLRTSSPDLSSSRLNGIRREGFLVEIRSLGSRQTGRPNSLVDRAFKVPLESHV